MSSVEIAGIVVVGLGSVLGLLAMLVQLIIKPMNDLTVVVTRLVATLEWVNIGHGKLESKVDAHDLRLDAIERILLRDSIA